METAGVYETVQLVRVTDSGVEKFFQISGKGVRSSGIVAKEMMKLMAIMAKNVRKKSYRKGEICLEDMMGAAATVHAISINKENITNFINYANDNQVQYSIIDTGKTDRELIAYPGSNDKVIEQYVYRNRENVTYTSILGETRQSTLRQINVNDHSYVRLYKDNIVAVDRNSQYIRVKMGTQDNPMYADMSVENIKIGNDKNYYISVRGGDVFTCYTLSGTQELKGIQMTNMMKEYQNREEEKLRYSVKHLSSCKEKRKMEYMNEPLKYKEIITSMIWNEQYGNNKRVVSFFSGDNRKTMFASDKRSSDINIADKLNKAALQIQKKRLQNG